jgi:hypothetical protein
MRRLKVIPGLMVMPIRKKGRRGYPEAAQSVGSGGSIPMAPIHPLLPNPAR